MNKRHYEHTLPNIRGSLSNTYELHDDKTAIAKARLKSVFLIIEKI